MIDLFILLIFFMVLILDVIKKSEYFLVAGIISIILQLALGSPSYAIAIALAIPLYNLFVFISIESVRKTLKYAEVVFEVLKPFVIVLLSITIGIISRRIIFVYMDHWTSSILFVITFFISLSFVLEPSIDRLSNIGKKLAPDLYSLSRYLQNMGIILGLISLLYSVTELKFLAGIPILLFFISLYITNKMQGVHKKIILLVLSYITALILSFIVA